MANIYSGMSQKEKDNERTYLTNLQNSGSAGEKEWATSQLKQLNSSSTPSYNQTWESGGRTYVGGVDVGASGTKVDTSNTSASINAAIKNNTSGGSSYRPNYGDMGNEVQYNPYEEAYKEAMDRYNSLNAQIEEQNRLAVEQGTNRLNAQKTNINQAAEDNARQAYIMQMQAKRALPQQLAGQGATGGTTETAALGIQTAYQNNINQINQNKANAIQEIDNAIVDLKNTGDLTAVEQVLANNQAALDSYMSMFDKGVGYNQWANQFNANRVDTAYDKGYQERAYQDALKQQQFQNNLAEQEFNLQRQEYENKLKQQALENELTFIKNTQNQKEKQEKESSERYNDIYKETKKRWETGNIDAMTINDWLAQQNITDTEYETILQELGIKTILDNLIRLGKLS
jgi:hypothetical protein